MSYKDPFLPSLLNLHSVFHVSQLHNYVLDPLHLIQMDVVQVRENLIVYVSSF